MHIYKKPSGTWAYRIDVGRDPVTGRRIRRHQVGILNRYFGKLPPQYSWEGGGAAEEVLRERKSPSRLRGTPAKGAKEWLLIIRYTLMRREI